jgi:hypothetical protein
VDVFLAGRPDPILVLDAMPLGAPEAVPNLPLEAGLYFARVHEVRVAGRFPIENVSDHYAISWSVVPRGPDDEREWNDGASQAEVLSLEGGAAQRIGFIGWDGDVDTYCLAAVREPLAVELAAIESLDLLLESVVDGRESTANEHGRGEPETLSVPGAEAARRVCLRVSAGVGAQRGDATAPYTLRLTTGSTDAR